MSKTLIDNLYLVPNETSADLSNWFHRIRRSKRWWSKWNVDDDLSLSIVDDFILAVQELLDDNDAEIN